MDNGLILIGVLLIILIFFVMQIPRHAARPQTIYVKEPANRSVIVPSIWNYPTSFARPMRPWGPRFRPGFRRRRGRGRRHF